MRGYSVRTFLIRLAAVAFCATPIAVSAQLNLNLNKLFETPETVQRASGEMDENLEIELGRGLMGRLIAAMPLVRDDAVQQYINDVGWWLVNYTERRSLPWRFAVTDTSTLGAFATPGGHIIVTRGLFALMQDEHELAGVLAHEMAHVLRKHHLKEIMRQAQSELLGDVAQTALSIFTNNSSDAQLLGALGRQVFNAGMQLYAQGLSREDELDADARGAVIAARAGYDAAGLATLLFTLEAVDASNKEYELMSSTHPPTRERIQFLEKMLEKGLDRYEGTLSDNLRFVQMQERLAR